MKSSRAVKTGLLRCGYTLKPLLSSPTCLHRSISTKKQLEILDNTDQEPPLNILGRNHHESLLRRNVGPKVQRNVALEAAVRMLCDHLIIYEAMDHVLNSRRLELLSETSETKHTYEKQALDPFRDQSLNQFEVLGVNESLLKALDMETLNQAHTHMSKVYNAIGLKTFSHYLNEVLTVSHSGPQRKPYIQQKTTQKGWFGSYTNVYQQDQFTAVKDMNKKLLHHLKNNFRIQGSKYGGVSDRRPDFLAEIAYILMTSEALPDLKTFNMLIRQFNLYRLAVPARMAFEALLCSELPMNNMIYTSALTLAISTSDKEGFMQLAKVFDFNSIEVPDGTESPLNSKFWERFHPVKMSSYRNHDWPEQQPEDRKLRARFFVSASPGEDFADMQAKKNMHSLKIYTTLIAGMTKFGWHWWIDVAIRKMAAEGFPLTLEVLTLNMNAARNTKDAAKARWTWNEILNLPLPTRENLESGQLVAKDKNGFAYSTVPFDHEAYLACKYAAEAVEDHAMLMHIEEYYRAYQLSQAKAQIELHQEHQKESGSGRGLFGLRKKPTSSLFGLLDPQQKQTDLDEPNSAQEQVKPSPATTSTKTRIALPPSVKNSTSVLFGGLLQWNPNLRNDASSMEGFEFLPEEEQLKRARPAVKQRPSAATKSRKPQVQNPTRTWYEELQ